LKFNCLKSLSLVTIVCVSSFCAWSQDSLEFSTDVYQLDEVVVTGQFRPQAASNSVYKVKTIDWTEIKAQGALQLNEVLQTRLNMAVFQDLAIGSSGLSLQGISGQNVKVLIDGVPVVGRNGNGNNTDLSQINLSNVERIEIVEGPMAVSYGANALAGVINLLTRQQQPGKICVNAQLQSESAGSEMGLDEGRHVQDINLGYRFNQRWSTSLDFSRNNFHGFKGDAPDRTYEWNPKLQNFTTALVRYQTKSFNIHYKFDFLDELIEDYGISQDDFQPSTGVNRPYAFDERYQTYRFIHQMHADIVGENGERWNFVISYSDFDREKSRFSKDLTTGSESFTTGQGDQDLSTYDAWVLRGAYMTDLGKSTNLQLGYDMNLEQAGGGRILDEEQSIQDYAFFASAEIQAATRLKLRPGFRISYNSIFDAPVTPSLRIKYDFGRKYQLRASYSRGFRSPSVRELYFEFVDSNHRIVGNPELEPEYGHNFSLVLSKTYQFASGAYLRQDFSGFYNTIDNRIALGQSSTDPTGASYTNILKYKTLGGNLIHELSHKSLVASLGLALIGRYNRLSEQEDLDSFLYTPEVTARLGYKLESLKITPSVFYKFTGELQSYFINQNPDTQEEEINLGSNQSYSWMDVTITRPLFHGLEATVGVKNLLNVRTIATGGTGGGTHSEGDFIPISYGRSYFIRLHYQFKSN